MKYLIYCGPGIGDFVTVLPMAKHIKSNDPDAIISLFTCSDKNRIKILEKMLPYQDFVDNIFYYSKSELFHDVIFLFQLGFKSYDYGFKASYFDTQYISDWPYHFLKMAVKKLIGARLKNKPNFKFDIEIPFSEEFSVYDSPIKLVNALGFRVENTYTSLFNKEKFILHTSEFCKLQNTKQNVTLVVGTANAPVTADGKNGAKPAKAWPYKYWVKLAGLLSKAGYYVVIVGGKKEKDEIQAEGCIFKQANLSNFCGKCSIIDSIGIICQSSLVIGADTGLMHCAGAVGVPSLTLFGCTGFKNYLFPSSKAFYITAQKSCSPCFGTDRLLTCNNFECMREILPEMVFDKAKRILEVCLDEN